MHACLGMSSLSHVLGRTGLHVVSKGSVPLFCCQYPRSRLHEAKVRRITVHAALPLSRGVLQKGCSVVLT